MHKAFVKVLIWLLFGESIGETTKLEMFSFLRRQVLLLIFFFYFFSLFFSPIITNINVINGNILLIFSHSLTHPLPSSHSSHSSSSHLPTPFLSLSLYFAVYSCELMWQKKHVIVKLLIRTHISHTLGGKIKQKPWLLFQ